MHDHFSSRSIKSFGYTYEVLANPFSRFWDFVDQGIFEPETFEIFNHFIKENDVVLDLGAWIGPTTLYLTNITKHVLAVDPDPVSYDYLQQNIQLNPKLSAGVKTFNLAISHITQEIKLNARVEYGQSTSSLLNRPRDNSKSETVQAYTLSDFVSNNKIQRVDFIKMDIEGAEFSLIPTLGQILAQLNYPTLYISFHYDFLLESQFLQFIKFRKLSDFFSRVFRKLKFDPFRLSNTRLLRSTLGHLMKYDFIFDARGNTIDKEDLLASPIDYIYSGFVFTNKNWIQHE